MFSGKNIKFSLLKNEGVGNQVAKGICHGTVTCTGCSGELLNLLSQREGHWGCLIEGFVQEQILVRAATGASPECSSGRGKFVECRIPLSLFPRILGVINEFQEAWGFSLAGGKAAGVHPNTAKPIFHSHTRP